MHRRVSWQGVTLGSGSGDGRGEYDLLGARRYEVDRIQGPLLAPHLVGDFANDLPVLHLEEVSQAHSKLSSNGIGNVGHFVPHDGDMADLIVKHGTARWRSGAAARRDGTRRC